MRDSSAWSRITFFTTGKKIKSEVFEKCKIKFTAPKIFACLQSVVATEMYLLNHSFKVTTIHFGAFADQIPLYPHQDLNSTFL